MGLFLSMSGVIGGDADAVVTALSAYAVGHGGSMAAAKLTTDDGDCLVVSEGIGGVSVLYPREFMDWDDAAACLSRELGKPVFSFHIHDGDLWMYILYESGEVVDQFNPIPDYWAELSDEERQSWQGNAAEVAKRVPGLSPDRIAPYLVQWSDDLLETEELPKAFPEDEFHVGEDWQLVDFMRKLDLDYPVDDSGEPHGDTYRFECESE